MSTSAPVHVFVYPVRRFGARMWRWRCSCGTTSRRYRDNPTAERYARGHRCGGGSRAAPPRRPSVAVLAQEL